MECLIQYLDDLEDVVYALALIWERIRRLCGFIFFISASVALQALGIYLALTSPPIAVATASLLLVTVLYRSAVHNPPGSAASA